MTLPPGFRFKPTDEELVSYYLRKRVEGSPIEFRVIADVDLYRCEPWDLPHQSLIPSSNDLEWFFFSPRDRKYPNGTRTNRATETGYWKATGRDRTVKSRGKEIGMKKTLVFYMGRAPNGTRTDWLMHEYRLQESAPSDDQDAYVLCRVFKKTGVTLTGDGPGNEVEMTDEEKNLPGNSPQHTIPKPEPPEETPALPIKGAENTYMQYPPLVTQPGQPMIPGSLGNQLFGTEDLPATIADMKFDRSASDLEGLLRLLEECGPPPSIDIFPPDGHGLILSGDNNASERNESAESERSGGEGEPTVWNPWDDSNGLYMSYTSRDLPPLVPDSPSPPPFSAPDSSSVDARDKSFGPASATVPSNIRVRPRLPAGVAHADGPRPSSGPARQLVKFQIRPTPKKEQKPGVQDIPESVESEPKLAESHREINHLESSETTVNSRKEAEEETLSRGSGTDAPPIVSNNSEGSPAPTVERVSSTRGESNDNKENSLESDVDDAEEEGLATGVYHEQKTAPSMTGQQQGQRRLNLENRIGRVLGSLFFQGKRPSVEYPCGVGSICLKATPIKCSCEKGHSDAQESRECECDGNPNPANVVASSCVDAPIGYPEKKLVEGEEEQQQRNQHLIAQDKEGRGLQRTPASEGSTKQIVGVFFMGVASALFGLFVFPSAWRAITHDLSSHE